MSAGREKRKSLVQALKSEGIIARDLCYVEKDGSSSGTEAGISMTLSTEKGTIRRLRWRTC